MKDKRMKKTSKETLIDALDLLKDLPNSAQIDVLILTGESILNDTDSDETDYLYWFDGFRFLLSNMKWVA